MKKPNFKKTPLINRLKIGQKVWFFDKYGDLQSGTILGLKPNHFPTNYHREIGESFDDVSLTHPRHPNNPNITMSICAKQTMIYTSKPNQNEFVDDRVEFTSGCCEDDCKGTINGSGWCDDEGMLVKFDYQECDTCGWNQAS